MKRLLIGACATLPFVLCSFFVARLANAQSIDTSQTYYIKSVYSGLVLDVVDAGTAPGTRVQQWAEEGGTNQQFKFTQLSNGAYTIQGVASGLCVDLYAGNSANGTVVQMWSCWGGTPQQWKVASTGGSQFELVNAGTGSCIDISGPSVSNGALAQQWACWSGSANQQYTLVPVSSSGGSGGGGATGGGTTTGGGSNGNSSRLHVSGNALVDGSGNVVVLHGVNIPSLEWGNGEPNAGSSPGSCWQGQSILDSVKRALTTYGVNFVRLPISQDRWWNAVDGQGTAYRATVDSIVQTITDAGAYVDVDLHWSDAGIWGQNMGQHEMPDDNTATVWADVAAHFAGNSHVLYGLYNEPHDVDWNTWRNGGTVSDSGFTYHTPGIQGLLNVVRGTGAQNVVIAGGLDWSFDLTGIVNGYALSDNNVVYDAHVYPWKGDTGNWDSHISVIAGQYPILIGEFGANYDQLSGYGSPQQFISTIQPWLQQHQYSFSAWNLHPTSTPALITDWCYDLTSYYGAVTVPWL